MNERHKGTLVAHHGEQVVVESSSGDLVTCHVRQNLPALAVGDNVIWQSEPNAAVVVEGLPRASSFSRQVFRGEIKVMAANCNTIVIVMAIEPRFAIFNLDRYIVAAEQANIQPIIVFNKVDILDADQRSHIENQLSVYESLGYQVLYTSVVEDEGISSLVEMLSDKVTIFIGQSGVGKSSLLNALIPDLDIQVGKLSESSGLGRHTTTTSYMYHLLTTGRVIDTPGFREFTLPSLERREIEKSFVEFAEFSAQCKFSDCSHTHERNCGIRDALEQGKIAASRYESYVRLYEDRIK